MVETLKNRINDELHLDNVGLVIIDEAHYNSFRKLLSSFTNAFILGVTATPLSSNIKLPMHESYDELIVGDTISSLIDNGFLAKQSRTATIGLTSLKVELTAIIPLNHQMICTLIWRCRRNYCMPTRRNR
jgi:hypothetical protein